MQTGNEGRVQSLSQLGKEEKQEEEVSQGERELEEEVYNSTDNNINIHNNTSYNDKQCNIIII